MNTPLSFRWDGDALIPLIQCRAQANERFVVGQVHRMIEYEDRSPASHNHEFGWLHEKWLNLPEPLAPLYPSEEHLRKRALIEAGYYNETIIDAGTHAAALRVAAYVRSDDEFALAIVKGVFVFVRKAKSQSRRAMNKAEFQASKTALMEVIDAMYAEAHGTAVPA